LKFRVLVLTATLALSGSVLAQDADRPGDGITPPRLIHEVEAEYTPKAMAAGIEGSVLLDAVVREDGTVGDVPFTRSESRSGRRQRR
jgi:hypothetical protein